MKGRVIGILVICSILLLLPSSSREMSEDIDADDVKMLNNLRYTPVSSNVIRSDIGNMVCEDLSCKSTPIKACKKMLTTRSEGSKWINFYGTSSDDDFRSVQQTSDGGYIAVGCSKCHKEDVRITKTYPNGDIDWGWIVWTDDTEWGESVKQTSDGGYILTGTIVTTPERSNDLLSQKWDQYGNKIWEGGWGWEAHSSHEIGMDAQQTLDGNYIIVGWTDIRGNWDIILLKVSESDELIWYRILGGSSLDIGDSVRQTSDGGYIIAGHTESYGSGGRDVWLIKTDPWGFEVWNKTFGGSNGDGGYSVQQTSDGGYIIAATTLSYGAGDCDVWLIKTASNGNKIWDKTFGGPSTDYGFSVWQTADGGYLVAGYTESYGSGGEDVWLIKTDSNGNEEWSKTFGGPLNEEGESTQETFDRGYVIAGWAENGPLGGDDALLIKGGNALPVALFTLTPKTGNTTTIFRVDASASYDPDPDDYIVQYEWDWGDNCHEVRDEPTSAHRYTRPGVYTMVLTVTDPYGAKGTSSQEVEVSR